MLAKRRLFQVISYSLTNLDFNEQYSYYMLMARKNEATWRSQKTPSLNLMNKLPVNTEQA
jgi:hypothetical protein